MQIAGLGDHRHQQMLINQPDHQFGLLVIQTKTRAETPGNLGTGNGMVFLTALGDVMQQHRDEQHSAFLYIRHQLDHQWMDLGMLSLINLGQDADRADQMLIHGIMMIHVELHHRNDPPEIRDKLAQHARFVHPGQHQRRVAFGGQDGEEQPVGLLVVAEIMIDQRQAAGNRLERIGMEFQPMQIGDMEKPHDIDRITLENIRAGQSDPAPVLDELRCAGNAPGPMGKTPNGCGQS